MENINRKHLRCYRKLQLWRVFHIVLAGDWMRLLPIQTFISMERRNVSDSMYLLWRGMKSIKNRYYCSLCFHWPGNQQKHLGLRQLSCTVVGAVNEVTETSHTNILISRLGCCQWDTHVWQAVSAPAWDPAFQSAGCSVLCPSHQGGHVVFQSSSCGTRRPSPHLTSSLDLAKSEWEVRLPELLLNEAMLNFVFLASYLRSGLVISILNLQFHSLYPSSIMVTHTRWLACSQILPVFLHMQFIFWLDWPRENIAAGGTFPWEEQCCWMSLSMRRWCAHSVLFKKSP